MRRVTCGALARLLPIALLGAAGCGSGSAASRTAALGPIGAGLRGPAGLVASIYGRGPATTAAFAFDPQGRLWLTAAGLETHRADGVYVIVRPGAPARRVLAGLDDPLGLAWYRDRLYVASVGRVDAYAAFDGVRFGEHWRILSGPAAGAENNLLVMAPDGRFVMGVSATCDRCVPASRFAGSLVSFRPDGSDLRLYASNIRAPFGLGFLPGTSELLVSMNQPDNLGARTPGDWLSLVREGQDWRFPACYGQGGPACAGVPEPIAVLDKHAAVGGIATVSGPLALASAISVLVTEWNSAKVQRVALKKGRGRYQGSVAPFLEGIARPLAITLAPDRSLLVGDWQSGVIYRISASASR